VRALVDADIPQVAELHRTVFGLGNVPAAAYHDYFTNVFLNARDRRIAPLIFQEHDGRIAGFLGVVPRVVSVNGRQYLAAVSSQFIVHPAAHTGLVALRLAKAYLEGPQDLSIADEANDVSRKIWQGLGGSTALLLSMYWTRALCPARVGLSFVRARRRLAPLAIAAAPVAALADAVAVRAPGSQFRLSPPVSTGEPLSAAAALAHGAATCSDDTLRAQYDERTFQALLDRVAARAPDGRVLNSLVRTGSAIAGWYVGHLGGDGVAEIAQIAAAPATIHPVLDHLFHHAWRLGAASVSGRLDPRFVQALSDKYCLFHRRGPWVLVSARQPELARAIDAGATCLSRFDGEWSLRFHPPRA
jgi:hypothetical protein